MIFLQYNFTHHPSWDPGYTQPDKSKNKGTASVFSTQQSRNCIILRLTKPAKTHTFFATPNVYRFESIGNYCIVNCEEIGDFQDSDTKPSSSIALTTKHWPGLPLELVLMQKSAHTTPKRWWNASLHLEISWVGGLRFRWQVLHVLDSCLNVGQQLNWKYHLIIKLPKMTFRIMLVFQGWDGGNSVVYQSRLGCGWLSCILPTKQKVLDQDDGEKYLPMFWIHNGRTPSL